MNPEGSPSGRFQAPVGRALEGDMGTPVSPPPHPHPGSLSHLGYGEECDYIRHHDIFFYRPTGHVQKLLGQAE